MPLLSRCIINAKIRQDVVSSGDAILGFWQSVEDHLEASRISNLNLEPSHRACASAHPALKEAVSMAFGDLLILAAHLVVS